jgi:hypothetical protein
METQVKGRPGAGIPGVHPKAAAARRPAGLASGERTQLHFDAAQCYA